MIDDESEDTLVQHHHHVFIGGELVLPEGTERLDVHSPATEEVIGSVPSASTADVDRAVAAARRAFDAGHWAGLEPKRRLEIVNRFAAAVASRSEAFVDMLSAEVGLPRASLPAGQIAKTADAFSACAEIAEHYPWNETRAGSRGRTLRVHRRPVGVVAAIVPWNAPLFIAALKLAPALTAGATVVLKPSEGAPLHTYLLAECATEAGIPPSVLNILVAGPEVSEYLVGHPGVDKVSFTGSTAVGRRIGELCGRDLRRCTLELGGKSAAILLDDLELTDATARMLVAGAMANSGQICAAQTRILAPRHRYAEVVEALADAVRKLRVGDPQDTATTVGPVISARQRAKVEHCLSLGKEEGARVVVGGGRPATERGWYVEPTLFDRVEPGMTIAREEIFGPVATCSPTTTSSTRSSSPTTRRTASRARCGPPTPNTARIAGRFRSGSVAVNSPAPLDVRGPFGGFKQSGIGREGGPEALDSYTEYQTLVLPTG